MLKCVSAALLPLLISSVHAANWYVDNQASGSNSGDSWSNAWTNTSAVVWSRIAPGDTLFLSGGPLKYGDLVVGRGGTSGSPITIRVGREPGHNSVVQMNGFSFGGYPHVILDGSLNDSFLPPTSVFDLPGGLTNNIGIKIWQNDAGFTSAGVHVNSAAGQHNKVRWVEIGPILTNVDGDNDGFGVRFINPIAVTNFVVEYCYIHDIRNDGINLNDIVGPAPKTFDACIVRWTYIGRTGDDGIQWSENGLTVANCYLDSHLLSMYHGHPDQIQFAGASQGYFKVVNNILRNKANSLIIGEHLITEGGTIGPMLIAGNVFYATRDWAYITNSIQAYGVTFSAWRPNADVSVGRGTFTNFFYLHNTMYNQTTVPFGVGRTRPDGATRSVWELQIKDSAVRNNLHLHNKWNAPDAGYNFNVSGAGDPGTGTNGVYFGASDLPMTHNINAGRNRSAAYSTTSATDISTLGNGNTSAFPAIATNDYTFQLSSNDVVAKDAACGLASLTNQFPELLVDLAGNPRFADGLPDIGALEFTSISTLGGPVLRLTFEDSLADGQALDSSGRGNHAYRFGHLGSPTNWPAASSYVHPVTGLMGNSARFRWYPGNGWGLYGKSGDYMAVTNISAGGLQSLSRATVMLWVKRDPAPDGDLDGLNEWTDDQGRYLSAGYGYSGAWTVGMFTDHGVPYSYVRVYTNNTATGDSYVWFGSGTRIDTGGNVDEGTLPWTHLAFTWDRGVLTTYCNGTNVASATLPITELTVRGPGGNLATGWIALGCDTHNGRPALTPFDDTGDQYPNHAWFNGEMDDVRIYDRALSPAEIKSVFQGTIWVGGTALRPPARLRLL